MKVERLTDFAKWGLVGILTAWPAVWVTMNLRDLGTHIVESFTDPSSHPLALDYAMGVLWWVFFALCIFVFARESRHMLLLAWSAKFFVVLVFMLLYEQKYGLDAFNYFYHAYNTTLTEEDWDSLQKSVLPTFLPGVTDTGTISRGEVGNINFKVVTVWLALMTGSCYHAMKVICAFLGLMGVWFFYRGAVVILGHPAPRVFYLLAFFPSILFWSSILGKDPLQFLFIGVYAYGGALWLERGGMWPLFISALALGANYFLRPWASLMALLAFAAAVLLGKRRGIVQALLVSVLCVAALFLVRNRIDDIRSGLVMDWLQYTSTGFLDETVRTGGSGADISELQSMGTAGLPMIIVSGLFRPLPFDARNPFVAMAAVENTIVLILTIVALKRFRFVYLQDPLVLWALFYVLAWSLLYGLIVVANFGSGARFKIQMWPFFLLLVGMLARQEGRSWLNARAAPKQARSIARPHWRPAEKA